VSFFYWHDNCDYLFRLDQQCRSGLLKVTYLIVIEGIFVSSLVVSSLRQWLPSLNLGGLGVPVMILMILSMLVIPMPALVLDTLFTVNIVFGLIIIMIAINVSKPLEFSSFPSILLLATMLRLSLNVASTRIVLIKGHEGPDAAGRVIEAFGDFVIAGNYIVGFIIFAILMIINFIVVTKGAGRVSEVIARFTLDAMPGKQMAIDADLNAGIIDQNTARERREEIAQESDFFGSMDGASKFVRGDAVAGFLILIINIVGGLTIGMSQHNLSFAAAGEIYVLLTIGDGLVAQIPALLLSLSTAIVVTRVTTSEPISRQAGMQLASPEAFLIAALILLILGIIPGMPHAIFLLFGLIAGAAGILLLRQKHNRLTGSTESDSNQDQTEQDDEDVLNWEEIEQVDPVSLEIGYGLIPLVTKENGGVLLSRIKGVRKKLSAELGFLLQPIRVRDNLDINADCYQILLRGTVRGKGEIHIGRDLAINPGNTQVPLEGLKTREPAFGLEAYWIHPEQRDYARTMGYTVVDAATAMATHLNTVLKDNASELLGHEESRQLLDNIAEKSPKLIEDLVPERLPISTVAQVLRNLVAESVSLRDIRTIVESLISESSKTKDADELTALIRPKISRVIMQGLIDVDQDLPVITLEPALEQMLTDTLNKSRQSGELVIDPQVAENLFSAIAREKGNAEEAGYPAVMVVSPGVRTWLAKTLRQRAPGLTVLAYTELPDDQNVKVIGRIGLGDNTAGN
jgi:flagellar biosynthesis protein FlhA